MGHIIPLYPGYRLPTPRFPWFGVVSVRGKLTMIRQWKEIDSDSRETAP